MKRYLLTALLSAGLLWPEQKAKAATPAEVGVSVCVVTLTVAIGCAVIVQLCRPRYELCYEAESSPRHYVCTQTQSATGRELNELRLCRGVYYSLSRCEAEMREANAIAQTNNSPSAFACGPVARTPAKRMALLSSDNPSTPAASWSESAVGTEDSGFAILTPTQITALTAEDWEALAGLQIVTNAAPAAFFRLAVAAD